MISISEIPEARRERAKYWFSVFSDWQKSGLSKLRYCKAKTINVSTFYHWLYYLEGKLSNPYGVKGNRVKARSKKAPTSFLAVKLAKEPPLVGNGVETRTGLMVVLSSGISLRVEKNFDPESLLQVIKVLEQPC